MSVVGSWLSAPGLARAGYYHIKGRGCSSYLSGVKKVVLVPLRVFSLKRSTVGALAVPVRVLGRKIMTGDI